MAMQSIEGRHSTTAATAPRRRVEPTDDRRPAASAQGSRASVLIVSPSTTETATLVPYLIQELVSRHVAFEVGKATEDARLRQISTGGLVLLGGNRSAIVAIERPIEDCSRVATDPYGQGELAARYLLGKGHQCVAMVCRNRDHWCATRRVEGFIAAMHATGVPVGPQSVVYADHQPLYGVLVRLMSDRKPTALFVADENLSVEGAYILRSMLGLRIPQDVSLLGMELEKVSQFQSPPLTTIALPYTELAAKAVDLLLRQMVEGQREAAQVVLPSWVIERESVAPG